MKKLFALLLALAMVFALAACTEGTTETSPSPSAAPVSNAPATTDPGTSTEPITIKWAMWDKDATAYYVNLKAAYEEANENVTIEFVDLGSADYNASLTTQLVGGELYDVISIKDTTGYLNLIDGNYIIDLTSYIAGSSVPHAEAYDDAYTYEGKLYQLAWRADPWVLFYNKTMFDALGVDYPETGITFSEYDALVTEVGEAMKANPDFAGKYATFYHGWRSTIQLYACTTTGDAKKLFSAEDHSYLKPYYEAILSEMANGYAPTWPDGSALGMRYDTNFVNQEFAMTIMGTWLVTNILSKEGYGTFDWGMCSYPVADGVTTQVAPATTTGIAVASASTQKDAAFAFAAWLGGPEAAKVLAATGAFTAYVDDEVTSVLFSQTGFPTDETSKQALAPSKTFLEQPVQKGTADINTALDNGNNAILKDGESIDDGIAIMDEGIAEVLGG